MNSTTDRIYKTSELELAAYLKARGHRLLGAKLSGRYVSFEFDEDASHGANNYFSGAQVCARDLFEAHRSLRALIAQVREHASQNQTGTENRKNEHHHAHRS